MGNGTEENPFTSEDVERLIKEHGGTAKGLDLSGKVFEEGIDLRDVNLSRIILKQAKFPWYGEDGKPAGANLENADLMHAHLEGAKLIGANLDGAHLLGAHLEGAYLVDAHLEGAHLLGAHLEGAGLERAYLEGADLLNAHLEGADLGFAHLEGADLMDAHLEGACFEFAHLEGANLSNARLEGANLKGANLKGAGLLNVEFLHDTRLEEVDWGNYILKEEKEGDTKEVEEREDVEITYWFGYVAATYRCLKTWYTEHGIYDVAGKFFFREMTCKRKAMKWWPNPIHRIWSKFISLICGYGEKPLRVIGWAAAVILVSTLIYFLIGSIWQWSAFWNSLYFSAVSFTALGYGSWLQVTNDWIKGIGAFESFIGVFTIALFLITFIRKMTR